MTDLVFVPSLLKPTFRVAGIESIEELMSHGIADIQARLAWGGWGRRKKTLFSALKAKIWGHAYRDESEAISECEEFGEIAYSERVRTEFLEEYQAASRLTIPDGYSFTIDGEIRQPNLRRESLTCSLAPAPLARGLTAFSTVAIS